MSTWDKFEEMREVLGDKRMLDAVYRYFGDWGMEKCVASIATDYDFSFDDNEEKWR